MENLLLNVSFRFDCIDLLRTVEDIYSKEECEGFVSMIESRKPELATNNPSYRNQDRVMIDDPKLSEDLFLWLRAHLPAQIDRFKLLRLNERLRFYRYKTGQRFSPHMDHWHQPNDSEITLLTVLIYFNSDFSGGETRFMEQIEKTIIPKTGLAAIFQHKI